VAGRRHALLALSYSLSSLLCGYLLDVLPFTLAYQVVFGLGFVGAAMSSLHLFGLRHLTEQKPAAPVATSTQDFARPGTVRSFTMAPRVSVGLRSFRHQRDSERSMLQTNLLRVNGYGAVILALFCFHFALYLPGPLFALRWVEQLGFSDWTISLGTAVFYLAVLVGALQLSWMTARFGNYRLTVIGALLLSTYPLLTALMQDAPMYLVASVLGGLAWAIVGGALANYLLERIPPENRAPYLAWYNLSLNAAIVAASLLGPLLAYAIGIVPALLVAFVLRLFGGLAIYRAH
jgi:MFS family permease